MLMMNVINELAAVHAAIESKASRPSRLQVQLLAEERLNASYKI